MKYINRKRRKELGYEGERKEEYERRNGGKEAILQYEGEIRGEYERRNGRKEGKYITESRYGEKERENMKEGTEGRKLYCRIKVRRGKEGGNMKEGTEGRKLYYSTKGKVEENMKEGT